MLPIVTLTGDTTLHTWFAGGKVPGATAGFVVPNPVPQRMIGSPGFAGTVAVPGNRPEAPTRLKSSRVATVYFPFHRKKAGDAACNCALDAAPFAPLLLTSTATGPSALSAGACTLICD